MVPLSRKKSQKKFHKINTKLYCYCQCLELIIIEWFSILRVGSNSIHICFGLASITPCLLTKTCTTFEFSAGGL